MFRSVPWRLVAWNVLVLTVTLILLEVMVYVVFTRQVYNGVDGELNTKAAQAANTITNQNLAVEWTKSIDDASYRTLIIPPGGSALSSACPPPPAGMPNVCPPGSTIPASKEAIRSVRESGREDLRTVEFQGHPNRVLTFQVRELGLPVVVQISRTVAGEFEGIQNLRLLLFLAGILGIALSALGSLFLANRALIPIRRAFARQRQFTADASHELRTPLALIRANAEMLTRHADRMPPGDDELLTEIIKETDHLNRLVGDLLTLARSDTETIKLEPRPVDFRALVSEVHEDVQRIAESRGIGSEIELDGPVTVAGDEVRLRQLLLILLDNALKYTDPGGHVDIALERHDHQARLVVSDSGIGIPAEDLPHIFERFYRVDRAREHESGGTGLGLAIAKWIVQVHNGNIKAESVPGRGTRFQVDLPAS